MRELTTEQVIEAIKADKSHKLNLPHNTITAAEHKEGKRWVVSFETSWGHKATQVVRIEEEEGELEIW